MSGFVPDGSVEQVDEAGGHVGWGRPFDPEEADAREAIDFARSLNDLDLLEELRDSEEKGDKRKTVLAAIADREQELRGQ